MNQSSNRKKRSIEDYEFLQTKQNGRMQDELGKGAFGSVRLAKDKITQVKVAIKTMSKRTLKERASADYIKREIRLQKKLDHPHVVKFITAFEDNENIYLVLEYVANGNLFFYLRKKRKLEENEAFVFFIQTALGIDYLHKKGIIHRDLKPENILIDAQGNVKICDFGWSAEMIPERMTFCGTLDYMSPEMLNNKPHDYRVDIWALGVFLFEMLHGNTPFSGPSASKESTIKAIISQTTFQYSPDVSSQVKQLISGILKQDPEQRMSMEQIFEHQWVKKYAAQLNLDLASFIYEKGDDTIVNSSVQESMMLMDDSKNIDKKQKPTFQQLFQPIPPQYVQPKEPRSVSPVALTADMQKQKEALLASQKLNQGGQASNNVSPSRSAASDIKRSIIQGNTTDTSPNSRKRIFDDSQMSQSQMVMQKYQNKPPMFKSQDIAQQQQQQQQQQQNDLQVYLEKERKEELLKQEKLRQEQQLKADQQKQREEYDRKQELIRRQEQELKYKQEEQQRLEQSRLEQSRLEQQRRDEQSRLEQQRIEQQRRDEQRIEQQRIEQQRIEQQRIEQQRRDEQYKLEQSRIREQERKQKELEELKQKQLEDMQRKQREKQQQEELLRQQKEKQQFDEQQRRIKEFEEQQRRVRDVEREKKQREQEEQRILMEKQMLEEQERKQQYEYQEEQKRIKDQQYQEQKRKLQLENQQMQQQINRSQSRSNSRVQMDNSQDIRNKSKQLDDDDVFMGESQSLNYAPSKKYNNTVDEASLESKLHNMMMQQMEQPGPLKPMKNEYSDDQSKLDWDISVIADDRAKSQMQSSQQFQHPERKTKSPNVRQTRFTNNRPTQFQDRNTYIGDLIDDCIDDYELDNDPQIQLFNQLDSKERTKKPKNDLPPMPKPQQQLYQQEYQQPPPQQPTQSIQAHPAQPSKSNKFSFGENRATQGDVLQTLEQVQQLEKQQRQANTNRSNKLNKSKDLNSSQSSLNQSANKSLNRSLNRSMNKSQQDLTRYKPPPRLQEPIDEEEYNVEDLERLKRSKSTEQENTYDQKINRYGKYSEQYDPYSNYSVVDQPHMMPRRSRISEHKMRDIPQRELQDMDFFDRLKFAFGCLSRRQQ